jgi:hypothetical protein
MLEKLTTHDVQDVSALFSLTDKCAKAVEDRAWHSPTAQAAKGESKPNAEAQAQGGGNSNNNNKKKAGGTHCRSYSGGWGLWWAERRQTPPSAIQ